jgi:hypothetical protein
MAPVGPVTVATDADVAYKSGRDATLEVTKALTLSEA